MSSVPAASSNMPAATPTMAPTDTPATADIAWPGAPIEGLAWGMTKEEALSALGLTEDALEPSADEGVFSLKEPNTRFGVKAESVVFNFSGEDGLIEISMGFAPADCQTVVAEIEKVYGAPTSGGVPGAADESYEWDGQSVEALDAATKDKLWDSIEEKAGAEVAERYRAGAGAMLLQQIRFGVGDSTLANRLCIFRGAWAAMINNL